MGSGIYTTKNGVRIEKTSREVKNYIMKINGWTSSQYDKQYDIFKNKLRAYENYERAHGVNTKRQSPAQLLYKEANIGYFRWGFLVRFTQRIHHYHWYMLLTTLLNMRS